MLNPRAELLVGESAFDVLRRARELEAQGRDIVHLEIGQPDFPTPAHICEAAVRAIHDGHTGYGPSQGLPELREAIAESAGPPRGVSFDPSNVVVAPGAKALLFYAVNALAGSGDEVAFPDPGFPAYLSVVAHSGARSVAIPLREEKEFRFDAEEFRDLVNDRTSLVIINSPQNPTGGVLAREDLEVIAEAAERHDFFVLSDEVYLNFCYDAPFESITSIDGMLERTILVDGFSKSFSMTGWRLGYAILPPALVKTFDLYNVNIASCANTFVQHAGIAALRGPQEPMREMIEEFRRRRDWLVAALNELPGVSCTSPRGAFYAFPNVTETGISSDELADRWLEEAGVAAVTGNSFGPAGNGYVRLSYATSMDNLRRAIERIHSFLKRSRSGTEG